MRPSDVSIQILHRLDEKIPIPPVMDTGAEQWRQARQALHQTAPVTHGLLLRVLTKLRDL